MKENKIAMLEIMVLKHFGKKGRKLIKLENTITELQERLNAYDEMDEADMDNFDALDRATTEKKLIKAIRKLEKAKNAAGYISFDEIIQIIKKCDPGFTVRMK